jgi:hypothetical protein
VNQKKADVLAVKMVCANTVKAGDTVEITGDKTVAVPTAAGSIKVMGMVCRSYDTECTVETSFREHRDDRLSGAAVAVGPFVFDSAAKVIAYDAAVHSPAAIRGLAITHTTAGDAVIETLEY